MSQQINLESKNLCVPLESFENYQVVYMYEENDNSSENTTAHSSIAGQKNSNKNSSCETDVEISSTVDDHSVNSASKSCNDTKTSSRIITENKGFSKKGTRGKSSGKHKITDAKAGSKKRKTKKHKEISQYDNSCNSSKNTLSTKYHFKEMPEKPINNKDEEREDIRDSHVSTTQETSESIEEDNSMAETNKKIPENIELTKKIPSKRGRPKKKLFSDNNSTPMNADDQIIKSSTEQVIKKKKRGRPKKQIILQTTVNETIAISENTVSEEQSQQLTPIKQGHVLGENEMNTILSAEDLKTDLPPVTTYAKKVYKSRKRKSGEKNIKAKQSPNLFQQEFGASSTDKSHNENNTESVSKMDTSDTKDNLDTNESVSNDINNVSNKNPDEDESDDICLSKLKETLEICDKNDNAVTVAEEKESNLFDIEIHDKSKGNGHTKRNSRMPFMSDFEYNIDSIVTDPPGHLNSDQEKSIVDDEQPSTSFVAESSNGRPLRRKGQKVLHYDEGSDEDPFANVELSDDDGDPRITKKGKRYFSDDEYIPGKKRGRVSTSDTADSDIDKKEEDVKKPRRKKINTKSPKKRGKKQDFDVSSFQSEDSVKVGPESSIINIDDDNVDLSDEFENFLAKKIQGTNLKIKRVSNVEPRAITPLEIPVINQISHKTVEIATQTNIYQTKTMSAQTVDSYDIPMKTNVTLTAEQAEKACAFLKDIVKTTSELGELMTQKSEDFIQKKINTKHVTDTFKMDYCVQKSFLLFKLAKHNLIQMEEDLSKQYENFLTENDMMQHREQPKSIIPSSTVLDNDSDCEIIEESIDVDTSKTRNKEKPVFNPKTVFLNKELSIKIAKKPSEEQKIKDKINIKGKNPVWISDSVLVKKVKPTQSFLAQDSRNKKPPDTYVTYEMVSNFFKDYYRQNASSICAPFITTDWQNFKKDPICCNYFHIEPILFSTCVNSSNIQRTDLPNSISVTASASNVRNDQDNSTIAGRNKFPKTLFLICFQAVQKEIYKNNLKRSLINITVSNSEILNEQSNIKIHDRLINPKALFSMCAQAVVKQITKNNFETCEQKITSKANTSSEIMNKLSTSKINGITKYPKTLFSLSVQIVCEEMYKNNCEKIVSHNNPDLNKFNIKKLSELCLNNIRNMMSKGSTSITQNVHPLKTMCFNKIIQGLFLPKVGVLNNVCQNMNVNKPRRNKPKSLFSLCLDTLWLHLKTNKNNDNKKMNTSGITKTKTPKSLKHVTYSSLIEHYFISKCKNSSYNGEEVIEVLELSQSNNTASPKCAIFIENSENQKVKQICNTKLCTVKTLYEICLNTVLLMFNDSQEDNIECNIQINSVDTVPEEIFVNLQNVSPDSEYDNTYFENEESNYYDNETFENDYEVDCYQEECNFESKPDFNSLTRNQSYTPILVNSVNDCDFLEVNKTSNMSKDLPYLAMVKIEPIENDVLYNEHNTFIKDEPAENLEETHFMPQIENVIAKKENIRDEYDVEQKVFSQSSLRVRKQFEPDSDSEADNTMSLLIPQTYESFNIDKLKNVGNSIQDDKNMNKKNTLINKKQEKRKANTRSALKKDRNTAKEEQVCKDSSSNSDSDSNVCLNLRSRRKTKEDPVKKSTVKNKDRSEAKEVALVNELALYARQENKDEIKEKDNKENSSDSDSSAIKKFNLRSRRNTRKDQVKEPVIKSIDNNNIKEIALVNELALFAKQEEEYEIRKKECKNSSSDTETDTTKNFNLRSRRKTKKDLVKVPAIKSKDRNLAKEMALVNELALFAGQEGEVEIREDDCKDRSSDSDSGASLNLNTMDDKNPKNEVAKEPSIKTKPLSNNEIQCNNVDSTQQISENAEKCTQSYSDDIDHANLDKNGLLAYNEYVNNLYSKIKDSDDFPGKEKKSVNVSNTSVSFDNCDKWDRSYSVSMQCDEPAELIQCEPTFPFYGNDIDGDGAGLEHRAEKNKIECDSLSKNINKSTKLSPKKSVKWKCYPIDIKDTKLHQQAIVVVDKLPETLIETYFKLQNISNKGNDNSKVESLTKSFDEPKSEVKTEGTYAFTRSNDAMKSNLDIPVPYIDKGNNMITPSKLLTGEQGIIENCAVSDNIKVEVAVFENILKKETIAESKEDKINLRTKSHMKTDTETNLSMDTENKNRDQLMLTADKMMNKELQLLHSQPEFNDDLTHTAPQKSTKTSQKTSKSLVKKGDGTMEENSSSEEEKQWVNTKEKLLKKLEKKQEDSSVEEAKSAKIVSEFLEKHDGSEKRKRHLVKRTTRSRRSILEQQKQLSVLSKELFGETSGESCSTGKKGSHSFGKGRRNIRKVIDKKSLARSTLIANMEELERKKRLLACRTQWKELLGSEDVLVVNDEVCLEYDFEENQSIVSIHPYFTSIMKAHQYDGVKFMWDACFESLQMIEAGYPGGGCILAHCMGLGKTLQVLALLHTVMTHPRVRMQRILVCCPLSTVLNWVDEIHKWIGPVTDTIKVFELSKLKKTYERAYQLEDWYNGGGIFIIGYELFRNLTTLDPTLDRIRPTIVNKIRMALLDPGPDMIICDEGHLLKNDSSILAVAMSRVATKRRIVLTGTPMQNNLREYYCMVNFVKPNLLGRYSEYSNRFENPIMNGQHRDSSEEDIKLMKQRTHILHKVLEGCLQRQEASVLYPYLPKKHEYTVFIPLTKCQSDLYKHYLKHYTRKAKQSVLRDFHILQKIWTHPQVLHHFQMKMSDKNENVKAEKLEDDLAREELAASEDVKPATTEVWWLQYLEGGDMLQSLESSNKLLAVFKILEECTALDDKVLIFSTSLFTMDTLEYFLKRINGWSLGKEYYRLDGSVPAEVRQKWCREFNAPTNNTTKLFLISTRAGCLGLNMTAANRVIILDTSWNPAHDIQSIFRVYRFGQKKDCYIYRLVALGTMEQKIYERAVTKQAVSCRVIDEQQIDRHYNMDELTELYKFDESGSGVVAGVALGVTDVALLRVACEAPLHAVHEHDSLLRGSAEQQLPEHERLAAWRQFEMEQTDKQMKNFGKQSLKTSSKKPHGHDYALSPTKAPDFNKSLDNETITNEKQNLKIKKERKRSIKDQIKIEGEPSTSENAISNNDDIHVPTVNKIKEIISHHYSESNGEAPDAATLVKNVQKLIFSGIKDGSEPNDALAKNVAKVLLESTNLSSQPMAPSPNSLKQVNISERQPDRESSNTESQNEIYDSDNEKRRTRSQIKRKRKIKKEHITQAHSKDDTSHSSKKKRKAALKAKEKLDSIDPEIIVNNDDDDWTLEDNNSILSLKLKKGKNKSVTKNLDNENEQKRIVNNMGDGGTPEKKNETIIEEINQKSPPRKEHSNTEISILVSDDDDDIIINSNELEKKSKKVEETVHNKETQKKSKKVEETVHNKETQKKSKKVEETVNKNETQKQSKKVEETVHNKETQKQSKKVEETVHNKETQKQSKKVEETVHNKETQKQSKKVEETVHNKETQKQSKKVEETVHNKETQKQSKKVEETVDNKETQKECTESNDKDKDLNKEEQVPLHSSLLKNQNFIKIVAHTYMSGNKLLEENAAFLAAQYSTQNALREMEAGREICSGPLYDIAIKIVGKDILKQLHTTVKNNVGESPKKSVDQSPTEPTTSQVNAATVKPPKKEEESKPDRNTSKRTQERRNSSDSDDLVLVESKIDEPKCPPAKKTREENSRKDSTSTAKESNERVTKVFVPIDKKNEITRNATLPMAPSASTKKAPNVENIERRGSHASSPSVVDDDDDVRVVDEPAATNKPSPTYSAPNLRRRNSQPLAVNCVIAAEKPKEIPSFKSSQTPGSKKHKPAVGAQVEPSLIIPDIDLDDESSDSMERTKKNSTNSPPVIKSSQTKTSLKTKTPIKSQSVEEQYIIPDIDLDESSTENTEQTEAVQIKNSTTKPTTAAKNLKDKQALIDAKAKTPVKAQTVETPVIISDIDLDDSSNENTDQTSPKANTSVKTQFVKSSLIIPDIILDDDSPEHSETERTKIKNTPVKSSTIAKTDKQAAVSKTKATVSKIQSAETTLIIPDIDLDDDCTEQKECTEIETKISQTAKSNVTTKPATRLPSSTLIEPQLFIPDICLDDDSDEHSGEAESNSTTNVSAESSQIITNPVVSPVVTENIVEQPLYLHEFDLNKDSTGQTVHIEVSTEPTKKASGSDTICLDSDDEEAIVINEKAIHDAQKIKSPLAMPAVSAANICHTQATSASTQNPGPSVRQTGPNHTADVPVKSKNKDLDDTGPPKSKTTEITTCVIDDDDISVIEHVEVASTTQNKTKIATNTLKRPHKIGEVLRFPMKMGQTLSDKSTKVGSESDKKAFKIVKVYASKASDDETEKKKAKIKPDNDPLRILKDVVHIKADNFDKVKSPQTKPATSNAVSSQSNSTAEPSSSKQKQVKIYGTRPKVNFKPNILLKTVMPSSSIDLTNADAGPSKDYPKKIVPTLSNAKGEMRLVFPKVTTKTGPIVGSAKDIVIGRKVEKTPSKPTTNDSVFQSSKKKIVMKMDNVQSSNSKKRTTTSSDNGQAKKTKPLSYQHLTLKDFNIDDFDDVIELE